MSIKVAEYDFTRKINDFDTFQKLLNNVGNLGPPALNGCPKCKKSPNLVTLLPTYLRSFSKGVRNFTERYLPRGERIFDHAFFGHLLKVPPSSGLGDGQKQVGLPI